MAHPPPPPNRGGLRRADSSDNLPSVTWDSVREEAQEQLARERDFLGVFLTRNILDHATFSQAMTSSILNHFFGNGDEYDACLGLSRESWLKLLCSCFSPDVHYDVAPLCTPSATARNDSRETPNDLMDNDIFQSTLEEMGLMDLAAIKDRDPAAGGLVNPFLYFKGYKAIQAHRMAHVLWRTGNTRAALSIQSKVSELFDVDIHPAAKIGPGLMIDHATGIVIGETAVIGKNCSFLHRVTLGGTRKIGGNRHPKLGNDVLIGCGATLLGNITIDSNSKIGSGSVVLTSMPACVTVVGNPARIVGKTLERHAAQSMDLGLKNVQYCLDMKGILTKEGILSNTVNLDPQIIFAEMVTEGSMVNGGGGEDASGNSVFSTGTISLEKFRTAIGLRFGVCPSAQVVLALNDGDDSFNLVQYENVSHILVTSHSDNPAHKCAINEWELVVGDGGNLSKFLIAVARLEVEGAHANPDAELEVGMHATKVISDLSLVGINLELGE